MPFLAILPALFELITKFLGNAAESPTTMSVLLGALSRSPTGSSIVNALEKSLGPIENQKKQQFILETDSLLGQVQLDMAEVTSKVSLLDDPRRFVFLGLALALLMSVLVEPTINYLLGFFNIHTAAIYELNPIVIGLIAGLCGLHQITTSFENTRP